MAALGLGKTLYIIYIWFYREPELWRRGMLSKGVGLSSANSAQSTSLCQALSTACYSHHLTQPCTLVINISRAVTKTLRSREGEQITKGHTARNARDGRWTGSTGFRSPWNAFCGFPRASNLEGKTDPEQPDPRSKAAPGWGRKSPCGWRYLVFLHLPPLLEDFKVADPSPGPAAFQVGGPHSPPISP